MIRVLATLYRHRELAAALAWKQIAVRYKQSYFGLGWSVLKPLVLVAVFSLLRGFVGIDSGTVPYAVLTFAALIPWILFQESISDGVNSIVSYADLIKKIYFPREVIPVAAVLTKLLEFCVNLLVLLALMAFHGMAPTAQWLWLPLLACYAVCGALAVALTAAALNVYYRDVGAVMPVMLSLLMYCSPIIYPLRLVQDKLLTQRAMGEHSELFYGLYLLNPLAGLVDACQRVLLLGQPPDLRAMLPGVALTAAALPIGFAVFKRAEARFADFV